MPAGVRGRRSQEKLAEKARGDVARSGRTDMTERTLSKTWKRSKKLICLGYGEMLHSFVL